MSKTVSADTIRELESLVFEAVDSYAVNMDPEAVKDIFFRVGSAVPVTTIAQAAAERIDTLAHAALRMRLYPDITAARETIGQQFCDSVYRLLQDINPPCESCNGCSCDEEDEEEEDDL